MKIKTVALIGAGAVGSYVTWGLLDKLGDDFCIIADGRRKERLESEGIIINDNVFKPLVKTPQEARGADLIIVAVKYGALRTILPAVKQAADDHTIVMSLMNGVDSESVLAEAVNADQILYSLIKIASVRDGQQVSFVPPAGPLGIYFGETQPPYDSDRVLAVADLFNETSVNYHIRDQIRTDIWSKFAFNVADNLTQAVIGCGVGAYADSEHADAVRSGLEKEVIDIALKEGVDLTGHLMSSKNFAKAARYSTLQDLDAGRHTEIDMLSGVVIKLGKKHGMATPYNEMMYHLIKAIEEKNDGKFDYE